MESAIVTKDSFRDWKANPVTKAVFNEIQTRVIQECESLGDTAGIDPLNDRFKVGMIQALYGILRMDVSDVKEPTDGY